MGEDRQAKLFGTDPHKLHRKNAVDTSVAAAHLVDTTKDEAKVFMLIKSTGAHGATLKELAGAMGKDKSSFSGRISALLAKKLVVDMSDYEPDPNISRRDGCRVVVAKEHVPVAD